MIVQNPSPPQWVLLCGVFHALAGLAMLAFPTGGVSAFLRAFPRAAWGGRVLSALAWLGAAWAIHIMPLDILRLVQQPHVLIPLTLALALLTWWWMPDLLACRGVAGLLMLFPCPLFAALRAHPSAWRLLPILFAYAAAVIGMAVMFSPHHMRRAFHFLADRPPAQKICAILLLAIGALFIALAFTALSTTANTP